MSKIFGTAFAANGDMIVIPDGEQVDGSVSYEEGFGPDYQKQPGTPGYKFVPRGGHNRLFHDLTEAAGEVQIHGFNDWSGSVGSELGGYAKGAFVWLDGDSWYSRIPNNTTTPGTDSAAWWSSDEYMISREAAEALISVNSGAVYVNAGRVLQAGKTYLVDTTGFAPVNGLILIAPPAPVHGDSLTLIDPNNNWGNSYWSLELGAKTIEGLAGPLTSKAANTQWSIFYNQTRWEFF